MGDLNVKKVKLDQGHVGLFLRDVRIEKHTILGSLDTYGHLQPMINLVRYCQYQSQEVAYCSVFNIFTLIATTMYKDMYPPAFNFTSGLILPKISHLQFDNSGSVFLVLKY